MKRFRQWTHKSKGIPPLQIRINRSGHLSQPNAVMRLTAVTNPHKAIHKATQRRRLGKTSNPARTKSCTAIHLKACSAKTWRSPAASQSSPRKVSIDPSMRSTNSKCIDHAPSPCPTKVPATAKRKAHSGQTL